MTRDRFVTAAGSEIYFEDAGEGPTVLAIHGLGGGSYFFRTLATLLERRCRLVAIDLPGTGWSASSPADFTLESWIADIADVVARKLGSPVVVLGHSLGTILALELWRRHRALVRAMVFAGGLPQVRPMIRERLQARLAVVSRDGLAGWGPRITPGIFAASSLERHASLVAMYERLLEAGSSVAYVRSAEILLAGSASDAVPTVTVPCLAMTGRDDQYAPPEAVAAFSEALAGPKRTVVLESCGHLPFLETPEPFADEVGAFLDELATELPTDSPSH